MEGFQRAWPPSLPLSGTGGTPRTAGAPRPLSNDATNETQAGRVAYHPRRSSQVPRQSLCREVEGRGTQNKPPRIRAAKCSADRACRDPPAVSCGRSPASRILPDRQTGRQAPRTASTAASPTRNGLATPWSVLLQRETQGPSTHTAPAGDAAAGDSTHPNTTKGGRGVFCCTNAHPHTHTLPPSHGPLKIFASRPTTKTTTCLLGHLASVSIHPLQVSLVWGP